jgi:hypothetical protein
MPVLRNSETFPVKKRKRREFCWALLKSGGNTRHETSGGKMRLLGRHVAPRQIALFAAG